MFKNLPNVLSVSRIFLAISLFFIPVMSVPFQVIYVLTFVTDMLDGNIARLTNTTTELGASLDSFADIFFLAAFLFLVFPWMEPSMVLVIMAIVIVVAKLVSFLWVKIATGTVHTFHNIISKVGFFGLMILPFVFMHVGESALWVEMVVMLAAGAYDYVLAYRAIKDFRADSSERS